jgi:hypothetical protein
MKKLKTTTKHLITTLLTFFGYIALMFLLYWVITMPDAKADAPRVKGEFILFITMQNGPVEETLFGGSFPNGEACIAYAKQNYPIDNKRWIAYKCIHEDVHDYLEKMKSKGIDI